MDRFEQSLAIYESAFCRWVRSTSSLVDAKSELIDAFMHMNYPQMQYSIDAISAMELYMSFPGTPQEEANAIAKELKLFFHDIDERYSMEFYRQATGEY